MNFLAVSSIMAMLLSSCALPDVEIIKPTESADGILIEKVGKNWLVLEPADLAPLDLALAVLKSDRLLFLKPSEPAVWYQVTPAYTGSLGPASNEDLSGDCSYWIIDSLESVSPGADQRDLVSAYTHPGDTIILATKHKFWYSPENLFTKRAGYENRHNICFKDKKIITWNRIENIYCRINLFPITILILILLVSIVSMRQGIKRKRYTIGPKTIVVALTALIFFGMLSRFCLDETIKFGIGSSFLLSFVVALVTLLILDVFSDLRFACLPAPFSKKGVGSNVLIFIIINSVFFCIIVGNWYYIWIPLAVGLLVSVAYALWRLITIKWRSSKRKNN